MKLKLPERRAVSGPGRQDGGAPAAAPLKTRGGKTARRVLRRIGYIAACCCCVGVMLASVAAVVFASYLARLSGTDADMPDLYVLKMAENSIVYAADPAGGDWTEYAVFTGENDRVWTPLEQFPQTLRDAVVSVEDRNFWNQRFGINPGRILGAAVNELTGHRLYGSRQGASTLEQQLIENLTGDSAQSISGKFKEISRAIVMAGRYSKDMILEAYLNIAPLTGTLSGMQAGAQQYFGKDASQLTLAESATLASIPLGKLGKPEDVAAAVASLPISSTSLWFSFSRLLMRQVCCRMCAERRILSQSRSRRAMTQPARKDTRMMK